MEWSGQRGGPGPATSLDEAVSLPQQHELEFITVDEALPGLIRFDAQRALIVELQFFARLNTEKTAELPAISPTLVRRGLAKAPILHTLSRTEPLS